MAEKLLVQALRLPEALCARAENVAYLRNDAADEGPWQPRVTRSAIMREALERGLVSLEAEAKETQRRAYERSEKARRRKVAR